MPLLGCTHHFDSIAFCGGCAKGAFQIGAWAALEDLGLTRSIRTVSGTSIGGLNAVLFALGDLNRAKEIWNSVREDTAFTGFGNKGKSLFSRGGLRRILNHLDLHKLKYCGIDVYCNIHDTQTDQVVSKRINDLSKEEQIDVLLATSAMPGFYSSHDTVDDQINFIVGKILDSLNIENNLFKRWE